MKKKTLVIEVFRASNNCGQPGTEKMCVRPEVLTTVFFLGVSANRLEESNLKGQYFKSNKEYLLKCTKNKKD